MTLHGRTLPKPKLAYETQDRCRHMLSKPAGFVCCTCAFTPKRESSRHLNTPCMGQTRASLPTHFCNLLGFMRPRSNILRICLSPPFPLEYQVGSSEPAERAASLTLQNQRVNEREDGSMSWKQWVWLVNGPANCDDSCHELLAPHQTFCRRGMRSSTLSSQSHKLHIECPDTPSAHIKPDGRHRSASVCVFVLCHNRSCEAAKRCEPL